MEDTKINWMKGWFVFKNGIVDTLRYGHLVLVGRLNGEKKGQSRSIAAKLAQGKTQYLTSNLTEGMVH